ncbi:MAG: PAS domain S-box protein [Deltaproteobacteria bacterium]|nr:PAS domain S-box protein [Deltaproteobacteria bacterium]
MTSQDETIRKLTDECKNLRQQVNCLQHIINSHNHTNNMKYPPVGHLRVMLENSQEAIKVVQEKKLKFVNKKSAEIYGYSCEEMTNKHMREIIHPDDYEKVLTNYTKRVNGEKAKQHYPYRIVDKYGNIKWIEVSGVLSSWKGKPAIITFMTEITRRVNAEEDLKKSQRLLSDIIDFLPEATFAIDCQKRVIIWNKRMEEMTDIKSVDIIGKDNFEYALPFYGKRRPLLINLLFEPDILTEKMYSIFKREENSLYAQEYVHLRQDEYRWLRAVASLVYDHNENIVGAIESIRDITDLKNSENELKNKSTNLEETNTALKVLLKHRENDRYEMEEKIFRNIGELVLPYMEKIKGAGLSSTQSSFVSIIEKHLNEIVSTFLLKMERKHPGLTPREVQIASLVKNGHTTKEISKILNIEMTTINNHRNSLRRKMGLKGKDTNLRSYLSSFSESNV